MEVPQSLKMTTPRKERTPGDQKFKCLADYKVMREIGEGSFSIVYLAEEKELRRPVAIKTCLKKQVIRDRRVEYVHREKEALARLSNPDNEHFAIVSLYATFQDAENLFFVLTYAKYGDLLNIMRHQPNKRFTNEQAKYYCAVLLSALERIHDAGIYHRDLKPENVLMKADMRIILTDFGSAGFAQKDPPAPYVPRNDEDERPQRRRSFVGTAQYVSPELLKGESGMMCDFWSLGVVLFQFLTGLHAFHDESEYLIFKRVEACLYKFPEDFNNPTARDLIEKLLVLDPRKRLGSAEFGGPQRIQEHEFFAGIPWDNLGVVPPPDVILDE